MDKLIRQEDIEICKGCKEERDEDAHLLATVSGILWVLTTTEPTIFVGVAVIFSFATLDSIIN